VERVRTSLIELEENERRVDVQDTWCILSERCCSPSTSFSLSFNRCKLSLPFFSPFPVPRHLSHTLNPATCCPFPRKILLHVALTFQRSLASSSARFRRSWPRGKGESPKTACMISHASDDRSLLN
jgi:hypothetical protein